MNIVVFGGNGFIGSHLVDAFLERGDYVSCVDVNFVRRDFYRNHVNNDKYRFYDARCIEDSVLSCILRKCDVCYYCFSKVVPSSLSSEGVVNLENDLMHIIKIIEIVTAYNIKLIYLSSGGAVYGQPKYLPIDENHKTDPINFYGVSKLCIEKILYQKFYSSSFNYAIIRISNAYGPRQCPFQGQGFIAAALARLINREIIQIWGDGTIIRDYIYITDIVDALIKCSVYEGNFKIFNIGSSIGLSINQILDYIEITCKTKINKQYLEGRKIDVKKNYLDISLARKELNWKPRIDICTGLSYTKLWLDAAFDYNIFEH